MHLRCAACGGGCCPSACEVSLTRAAPVNEAATCAVDAAPTCNQSREIPKPALFLAARAFVQYRRRGGLKAQVLPELCIGAHAAVLGWSLLTRDAGRFKGYFPGLNVLAP